MAFVPGWVGGTESETTWLLSLDGLGGQRVRPCGFYTWMGRGDRVRPRGFYTWMGQGDRDGDHVAFIPGWARGTQRDHVALLPGWAKEQRGKPCDFYTWMGRQSGWRRLAGSTEWSLEQHLIIELLKPLQHQNDSKVAYRAGHSHRFSRHRAINACRLK